MKKQRIQRMILFIEAFADIKHLSFLELYQGAWIKV